LPVFIVLIPASSTAELLNVPMNSGLAPSFTLLLLLSRSESPLPVNQQYASPTGYAIPISITALLSLFRRANTPCPIKDNRVSANRVPLSRDGCLHGSLDTR
jgi:hypothetical protein